MATATAEPLSEPTRAIVQGIESRISEIHAEEAKLAAALTALVGKPKRGPGRPSKGDK